MTDNNSVIQKIGRILLLILRIFKNCKIDCNVCKSSCVVGNQESEDIEIHRVKNIQNTLANEAKEYHKDILGYEVSEV